MNESNETPRAAGCCDWQDWSERAEKFVREDPTRAVGVALLSGVLLTIFPIGRLLGALVHLAFALARPLLLVLGAVKLYEEYQKKQKP